MGKQKGSKHVSILNILNEDWCSTFNLNAARLYTVQHLYSQVPRNLSVSTGIGVQLLRMKNQMLPDTRTLSASLFNPSATGYKAFSKNTSHASKYS